MVFLPSGSLPLPGALETFGFLVVSNCCPLAKFSVAPCGGKERFRRTKLK